MALAPLPFGSDSPAAIAFWCVCLAITAALCSTEGLKRSQIDLLLGAALLLAAYGVVVCLQMLSLPPIIAPNPVWAKAAVLLGPIPRATSTIARDAPFYAFGSVLANLLALSLGLVLGSNRDKARQILTVIAWSGAAYAAYGIVAAVIEPGMILWRQRPDYYGNVLGTFVNRNTAATYFGSCGAVWLLILCEIIKGRMPQGRLSWVNFSKKILSEPHRDTAIGFTGAFICIVALFMTSSRAGVVISLVGFVLAGMIYFHRDLPQKSGKLWVIVATICFVLLALQFFGGSVNERFDTTGFSGEGRFETYRSTLRMIADHPWLGTGLGTFGWAFPEYRSASSIFGVWDMAHSTPLQLAAETGLPLALLVAMAWIAALAILIRGAFIRHRDVIIPLGAATVALIGLVHSAVDFSLQIEGYAIVVMALTGAGLAQSFRTGTPSNIDQ